MVTLAPPATLVSVEPMRLRLKPALHLTDDELQALCELNSELRIERTSEGDLEIMSPAGPGSAGRGSEINFRLRQWAKADGTGTVFDSSAGFLLANGAMRAPDTSWVKWSRLQGLSRSDREKFLRLCPDFVVELRSATDSLSSLQEKLEEYMTNGAELGWLIDPFEKAVHVYRPGRTPEILQEPQSVSGDPVLPGFSLELDEIWNPRW